jgi:hypothetical protein
MPILYVHGVNVRSRDGFFALKDYLRRYLAPVISHDPDNVLIDDAFWGDAGVDFAWNGGSRPRSRILGQGAGATALAPIEGALTAAAYRQALDRIPAPQAGARPTGGLISSGTTTALSSAPPVRARDLDPDELSDLLAVTISAQVPDAPQQARLILAADAVAHEPTLPASLAAATSAQDEIDTLLDLVRRRAQADAELLAQGIPDWLAGVRDRLGEGLGRALDLPSYAISVVTAEIRRPLNDLISIFLGDVFTYLRERGKDQSPGEIPRRLLDKLQEAHANKQTRGGKPLVVLSHSMGGQIVYDALSHFLSGAPALAAVRVDFWCASASQVGFFEEAKLFLASLPLHRTGHPVPLPDRHLGVWWNVWDHNDFLSFTVRDIFTGVDDEPFDSGMSLLEAHGGYLKRPSFYRRFAAKLEAARQNAWRTP